MMEKMKKVLPNNIIPYSPIVPTAYLPETEEEYEVPLTSVTAKQYIGRRIVYSRMNPEPQLSDPVYLFNKKKTNSDQPVYLIVGPRNTGKTILIRVLVEHAWFFNFTPIFIISAKDDYINIDKPNLKDLILNIKFHSVWATHFFGTDLLHKNSREKRRIFEETFKKFNFNIKTLVPPTVEKMEGEEIYKLNPRLLDATQISDLITIHVESIYIKEYDKIYNLLWRRDPHMHFTDFLRLFSQKAKNIKNKIIRNKLAYIHNRLTYLYKEGYIADNGSNTLLKYFMDKSIVNLTFRGTERSLVNSVIVVNFIKQVIELVQKYKLSSFLIIDDLAFFSEKIRALGEVSSLNTALDQLINVIGRTTESGIRLAFSVQSVTQLPSKLRKDLSIFTHIFYTKPRKGFIRAQYKNIETELVDNIHNISERFMLRLPITDRGR